MLLFTRCLQAARRPAMRRLVCAAAVAVIAAPLSVAVGGDGRRLTLGSNRPLPEAPAPMLLMQSQQGAWRLSEPLIKVQPTLSPFEAKAATVAAPAKARNSATPAFAAEQPRPRAMQARHETTKVETTEVNVRAPETNVRVRHAAGRTRVHVAAPHTKVAVRDHRVRVDAPHTRVAVDDGRVRVRAPFVDLDIRF